MDNNFDREIISILNLYYAPEPDNKLILRTEKLMVREAELITLSSCRIKNTIFALSGAGLLITLCCFYICTVSTILLHFAPAYMKTYIKLSFLGFITVGVCILSCSVLVTIFNILRLNKSSLKTANTYF